MTAQRHKDSRARQEKDRTASPKRVGAIPVPRNPATSAVRPTTMPPPKRGESQDQLSTANAAMALSLGPGSPRALPPAELSLLERAERLRDDLLRSKLTHPDPWSYTAKARAWGERAQALVEEIAVTGQTPALHGMVGKLAAQVEGDADFQKARQLF